MIVGEGEILIKPLYLIMMKNHLGNVKQCKTIIKHKRVSVNGNIVDDPQYPIYCKDCIQVDGKVINADPFVYIMMNKPKGYICANKDQTHLCVVDLISNKECCCIGRLDLDTTGLLVLTDDKSLLKRLLLPHYHIEKTYLVTTRFVLNNDLVQAFINGIVVDQHVKCLPAKLQIIDDYHCYVTLYEGKYHQIKKMFLSCANEVVALKRVSFAGLELDENLCEGEYRYLTYDEMKKLVNCHECM